jgi:hypothetical protein
MGEQGLRGLAIHGQTLHPLVAPDGGTGRCPHLAVYRADLVAKIPEEFLGAGD